MSPGMSGRDNPGLLLDTLSVAVPIEIMRLQGSSSANRLALARELGMPDVDAVFGEPERRAARQRLEERPDREHPLGHADAMMFGGPGAGRSLGAWAKALAVLAYQPGGVRLGPLGWCAAHPRQRWADGDKVCAMCLAEEIAAKVKDVSGPEMNGDS